MLLKNMIRTRTITSFFNTPVYPDEGDYFGDVEEAIIVSNKVYGWRIRATRHSSLGRVLTGAKGVVVPHSLVKSMGDIIIISKTAVPAVSKEEMEETA